MHTLDMARISMSSAAPWVVLLLLLPAAVRGESFVVKGPGLRAQEEGLKAAAEGRYNEALPLLQKALKGAPTDTFENIQRVATVRNALGGVLKSLGRFDEAVPVFEAALLAFRQLAPGASARAAERTEDLLRGIESETAVVMNNLGSVRAETGRREEARSLYEGALRLLGDDGSGGGSDSGGARGGGGSSDDDDDDDGDDDDSGSGGGGVGRLPHGETRRADAINNLADLCHSEGDLGEAERLHTRALEIRQRALGDEHPAVGQSVNNLAVLLMDQRRVAEALPLLRRAAKLAKAQLGGKHAHYATALSNLAAGLEQNGLHDEARKHLKRALGINKRALGEEHASTKDTATNLERVSKRAVGDAKP